MGNVRFFGSRHFFFDKEELRGDFIKVSRLTFLTLCWYRAIHL